MSAKNGTTARWIAGLFIVFVLGGLSTLSGYVVANDKQSRDRDGSLEDKIHKVELDVHKSHEKIMVALKEISTEQKYTKQMIKRFHD